MPGPDFAALAKLVGDGDQARMAGAIWELVTESGPTWEERAEQAAGVVYGLNHLVWRLATRCAELEGGDATPERVIRNLGGGS